MSAEVAEESDPSTTVFPAGRTCVFRAECRSASGTGFSGSTCDELQHLVVVCIKATVGWMMSNRLQLNTAKTEVMWCASAR